MQLPSIPTPVKLAAGAVLLAVAFSSGWTVKGWQADSERLESVQRAIQQADQVAEVDDQVSSRFERERESVRQVFNEIEQGQDNDSIVNPGYRECGLSPAGFVLWNAANAGRLPSPSSQPDDGVPGGTGSPNTAAGRLDSQSPGGNEPVPHSMQETEELAGLGEES